MSSPKPHRRVRWPILENDAEVVARPERPAPWDASAYRYVLPALHRAARDFLLHVRSARPHDLFEALEQIGAPAPYRLHGAKDAGRLVDWIDADGRELTVLCVVRLCVGSERSRIAFADTLALAFARELGLSS